MSLNLVDLEVTPFSAKAELQAELDRLRALPPGDDVTAAIETVEGYIELSGDEPAG